MIDELRRFVLYEEELEYFDLRGSLSRVLTRAIKRSRSVVFCTWRITATRLKRCYVTQRILLSANSLSIRPILKRAGFWSNMRNGSPVNLW